MHFLLDNMKWSVIPIQKTGKKPAIKSWKEYQKRLPTKAELDQWDEELNGNYNIAVITGGISGISVVDIDEHQVTGTVDYLRSLHHEIVPNDPSPYWDNCYSTKTPNGGYHWIFKYNPHLVSRRVIPAVDIKSDGGYIIIPPSEIVDKKYQWIRRPWRDGGVTPTIVFPPELADIFCKNPTNATGKTVSSPASSGVTGERDSSGTGAGLVSRANQMSVTPEVSFKKGGRDESLFHIANTLFRGGTSLAIIEETIRLLAQSCEPPFREWKTKVLSALDRNEGREKTLSEDIEEWIDASEGSFTSAELDRELLIVSKQDKGNRRKFLQRLRKRGVLESVNGKVGMYRKVNLDMMPLNYVDVVDDDTYREFQFPLGIEKYFKLMPKNIVIVGGAPDTGKTAFMLALADLNQDDFPVNYFSSEMGSLEFKSRLDGFHWRKPSDWNFLAFEREENFSDVIRPNQVNIIDFLEIYDNFYAVGQLIRDIWSKLDQGVAIIAIQKNQGAENPLGGNFARQKARLVLNLDRLKDDDGWYTSQAKITKAKNWRTIINPSGLVLKYDLADGCQFKPRGEWKKSE